MKDSKEGRACRKGRKVPRRKELVGNGERIHEAKSLWERKKASKEGRA